MADEFDLHTAENMKTIDIIPEIVEDPDESKKRRCGRIFGYCVE